MARKSRGGLGSDGSRSATGNDDKHSQKADREFHDW